ncbi:MAG: FtsW/RodA/SpoVE family cell cycle protein [Bacillota bacterium]|nr:FtsW/RodA/SpoVE family cell cycle protein [Bacillota bacterium]
MIDIKTNKEVSSFLNNICSYIKFKDAHEEIKLELKNHIEEKFYDQLEKGLNEEEALKKAISEMGDINVIGKQLNTAHNGGVDFGTILLSLILVFIGVGCSLLINSSGLLRSNNINLKTILLSIGLGIPICVLLYKFDYRKLQHYSSKFSLGTMLFLLVGKFFSHISYGIGNYIFIGSITINVISMGVILLIIALCGILSDKNITNKRKVIYTILLFIIPTLLITWSPNIEYLIIFTIVFLSILLNCGYKKRYVLFIVSAYTVFFCYFAFSEAYRTARLFSFVNYQNDPMGSGYIYMQLHKLIASAGLLGKGIHSTDITSLPDFHQDFIFTYITYAFGWAASIVLIIIITAFLIKLFKLSSKIKDNFGKVLIKSLSILLGVQFLFNILMNIGLAPYMGASLPFISYGGSNILLNFIIIGFIMGIYRRRNLTLQA